MCFADLGAHDMIDAHGVIWTCGRVVRDTVVTKDKRAEFAELFAQFLPEYPPSPAGQTHITYALPAQLLAERRGLWCSCIVAPGSIAFVYAG